jgi:mannose-6-phosphate isomerase-like protein (cupin superfamily)
LDEAFLRDESALLKACELSPKKTRGTSVRVVVPQEHGLKVDPDVQTFYRSLDLVPDAQPIRSGGFVVPVGARTVTLRESKIKMVFRPRRGKGVAYLGQSESELQYGYVAVPPDTAYYFENTGSEPLELEYVGLKP